MKYFPEIFWAVIFTFGSCLWKPFVEEREWNDKVKSLIDFIIVAQSWIICPTALCAFLLRYERLSEAGNLKPVLIVAIIIVQILVLLRLLSWGRIAFEDKSLGIVVLVKTPPIVALIVRVAMEADAWGKITNLS